MSSFPLAGTVCVLHSGVFLSKLIHYKQDADITLSPSASPPLCCFYHGEHRQKMGGGGGGWSGKPRRISWSLSRSKNLAQCEDLDLDLDLDQPGAPDQMGQRPSAEAKCRSRGVTAPPQWRLGPRRFG